LDFVRVLPPAVFFTEFRDLDAGPDPELDAYRLAHFYGQNPEVFLAMPLDDLSRHMAMTMRLRAVQSRERAAQQARAAEEE
jgi:hypothetical protein